MTLAYSEENAIQQALVGDDRQGRHRRYLDLVGDGTGSKEMNVGTNIFRLTPPTAETFVIDELCISAADAGVLNPVGFVSIAALSTGILLEVREAAGSSPENTNLDLLDGLPIKNTIGLMELGDAIVIDQAAACAISVKMKLYVNGRPLRVSGNRGESLVCQIQDNLSGLDFLRMSVKLRQYTNL